MDDAALVRVPSQICARRQRVVERQRAAPMRSASVGPSTNSMTMTGEPSALVFDADLRD
jgi:hypothetical protein